MGGGSGRPDERAYAFGDCRLVPGRQLLLRRGQPVRIGTRAFDLLRLLVERAGEVVSKEELIGFAWPSTFVHDANLKVNIAALRRALPQGPAELPYIATVPGRGYRFVASVSVESDAAAPDHALPRGGGYDLLPGPRLVVGRDDDVADIAARLRCRGFVTIVGPAGVGKTTAAVAAARRAAAAYPDGVCFVDLAAIGDPKLVNMAIASSLGTAAGMKDLLAGIVESLRGQRRLMILDNCEHVLSAAAVAAQHLHASLPDVGILATSREPLRSQAEAIHRLPPLRCPTDGKPLDRAQAMAFSAVELFVARAHETSGYRLSDDDAPVIAGVCRRLDGIALAIELAAPRLQTSDPPTLLRLLSQSFDLLSHGPRNAPLRQQALLATLDWSYRLLSEDEAALLRLLSVFAGGFALEDVIGVGRHLGVAADDVAVGLESLASKSLLSRSFSDEALQYRLLDATRSYAGERLRAEGEQRRVAEGHAGHLLRLFERAEAEWQWRTGEDWVARYAPYTNDLRKAIDWALGDDGAPELGIRLTTAAIPLWNELSSVGESRQRVHAALLAAAPLARCDPALLMKLTTARALGLTFAERLQPEAEAACREALRLATLTGDTDHQLRSLWGLAVLQSFTGCHRLAAASLDEFKAIAERTNARSAGPSGEQFRMMTAFYRGDVAGGREALKKLAEQHDTLTRRSRISQFQVDHYVAIRVSLAFATWVCGDPAEATRTATMAVDGATAIGHVVSQSNALALAAIPIALWTGDLDAAERHAGLLTENLNQLDLAIWAPLSRFFGAAIRHRRGDAEGFDGMRAAFDELLASNFLIRVPLYLSMLAETALERGQVRVARASIDDAISRAERQEEAWCRPELLRVLGIVQRAEGDVREAQRSLRQAAAMAGEAGSRSFQLRAIASLAS